MNIREYRNTDKLDCIAIFKSNVGKSFTIDELPFFEHWLDNADEYPYFVVEHNDKIVGCGGIYFDQRYHMAGLCWGMIDPSYQKQGIGRDFTLFRVDQIKEVFPESNCFIETTQHAAGFYLKLGFKVCTIQKNGFDAGLDRYFLEYRAA